MDLETRRIPTMQTLIEMLEENNRMILDFIHKSDPNRMLTRKDVMDEYGVSRSMVYRNQRSLGFDPGNRESRIRKVDADRYFLGSN